MYEVYDGGDFAQALSAQSPVDIVIKDSFSLSSTYYDIDDGKTVSIVGDGEGDHKITLTGRFRVTNGANLVLGDSPSSGQSNPLEIASIYTTVTVTDGSLTVNDGIKITTSGSSSSEIELNGQNATATINGGIFEGFDGISIKGGAYVDAIRGGVFNASNTAIYLENSSEIGEISAGTFKKTSNELRSLVHLESRSHIGKISGGDFDARIGYSPAVTVIRGSSIGEISGGTFSTTNPQGGTIVVWNDRFAGETTIGLISGGTFISVDYIAVLVNDSGAKIDSITGGNFIGERALQVDIGAVVNTITGGTFTASAYAIFNYGYIGLIGGNAVLNGMLFNYSASYAYGTIGEIGTAEINSSTIGIDNGGIIHTIAGTSISAVSSAAIYNYGVIDRIAGVSAVSEGSNAITSLASEKNPDMHEIGHIGEIDGGEYIGNTSAINSSIGLNKIHGGTFWGKNSDAIIISHPLILEPDTDTSSLQGIGRYWGQGGVIFNDEGLVAYPGDFYMSSSTLPVNGINDAEFKYLTRDAPEPPEPPEPENTYTIVYNVNGGIAGSGPEAETGLSAQYGHELATSPVPVHENAGGKKVVFLGWTASPHAEILDRGMAWPQVIKSVDITNEDITVYALWGFSSSAVDNSLIQILTSVAMEEIGLSHIINAEGEKLQYSIGTLDSSPNLQLSVEQILEVNESVKEVLKQIAFNQMFLGSKMSEAFKGFLGK
ncbi:MAG: hypothetical protein FWG30_04110 [Eubacteriaceae bacterium]|nr:hypothetical protein [Eubacteriaceae bacterium]